VNSSLKTIWSRPAARRGARAPEGISRSGIGQLLCSWAFLADHDLSYILEQTGKRQKLGDILLKERFIDEERLKQAGEAAQRDGISLEQALLSSALSRRSPWPRRLRRSTTSRSFTSIPLRFTRSWPEPSTPATPRSRRSFLSPDRQYPYPRHGLSNQAPRTEGA